VKKSALILFLLFLAVYIAPLGMRPLFSPDEARYAEIAREMLETGDFIVPRLDGFRYFEKPVFGYWLYAGSMSLFGQNPFALRLPCALAAGLAALSIFLLARRFAGGYMQGMVAAAVYLSMPMVFVIGTVGILDSVLSFLLTATFCLFYCALEEEDGISLRKILYLLSSGVFCGFAFLTKGFLAFAIIGLTISAFLIWERRWKDLLTLPWIPAVGTLAVAAPWALSINSVEPGYWNYFFWVEHIQRFTKDTFQHTEPPFFFVPVLLAGAATWLFLLPAFFIGIKEAGFKNPVMKYCVCWLLVPFLFFSLSRGKLPPYILPCFAPLAVLIAVGLCKCNSKGWRMEFQAGLWPLLGALTIGTSLFVSNQLTGFPATLYLKGENMKWILAAIAGAIWVISLAAALKAPDFWHKMALFCVGPVSFMFASHFIIPERVIEGKSPVVFLERNEPRVSPGSMLVSFRDPVQTVAWVFKRSDIWLYKSGGELDEGLKASDASHRRLNIDDFNKALARNKGRAETILIVPKKIYDEDKDKLPSPAWMKTGGEKGYVMMKF